MNDKFNNTLNALLSEGRLGYAIGVLRKNCDAAFPRHPDLLRLQDELDRIADTYSRMREFLLDGTPDPDRDRLYEDIKDRIRQTARSYLYIINEDRLDPFFAEYRLQKVRGVNFQDLASDLAKNRYRLEMASETEVDPAQFVKKNEELTDLIFRRVWVLPPWAADERAAVGALLVDEATPFEVKSQIVSALLLGLLKFNDPAKFYLLLSAYDSLTDERLEARVLTAIVLVLARWGRSALIGAGTEAALSSVADSILTYTRLREVVMTLIRTRDTDRVNREVSDAFNTTMKEISPEILDRLRREGMTADSGEAGMNPEWEKLMKNKDIEEKMKAINDMQLEGMDVMMQTFSKLKSFAFFRDISNWFLPFSPTHTAVAPLFEAISEEGFSMMGNATDMCGADRFSFALGLMQMPEERRRMLAVHIGGQTEAMKDLMADRANVARKSAFASEALSFARDLYRFAKIYPRRKDFHDPFESPLDFLNLPELGQLLVDDQLIASAADFYFDHGYYPLALGLYEIMVNGGEAERHIFEKIGFCHQMASDYRKALDSYEKADLFSSDADKSSTWLIKKLAFTSKALGLYEKAAEYYLRVLESNPDDLNAEFHLATVLLRAGDLAGARERISKVSYLDPDHQGARRVSTRLRAHEAFAAGDYRRAAALYTEARGDSEPVEFLRNMVMEVRILYPDADVKTLQILLDTL